MSVSRKAFYTVSGVIGALVASTSVAFAAHPASITTQPNAEEHLNVCTSLPYRPFEFQAEGSIIGFDVDIVTAVAKSMNRHPKMIDTPFEKIDSGEALKDNTCHMVAAALTITEGRKKVMAFSNPYFNASQVLMVKAHSPIKGMGDLAGKKVGVQEHSTGEDYAKQHLTTSTLVAFPGIEELQKAVQTGAVDAGFSDNGPLLDFANTNDDVSIVASVDTKEQYGFAVRADQPELLAAINNTLTAAKADGRYAGWYQTWFGVKPPA